MSKLNYCCALGNQDKEKICEEYFTDQKGNLTIPKEKISKKNSFKEVPNIQIAISSELPFASMGESMKIKSLKWDDNDEPFLYSTNTTFVKAYFEEPETTNVVWVKTADSYYILFVVHILNFKNDISLLFSTEIPIENKELSAYQMELNHFRLGKRTKIIPKKVSIESNSSNIYRIVDNIGRTYIVAVKQ